MEADRDRRLDRRAGDLAGRGVDPRGDVGGDHRHPAAVDGLDRGRRGVARRALETGAEDRVDDRPGAVERGRGVVTAELAKGRVEALQIGRGIAGQLAGRPQQQHLDLVARSRRAGEPRPARRRRCCPCRRRSGSGPVRPPPAAASASASPAASISSSDGTPRSEIAHASVARIDSASCSGSSQVSTQRRLPPLPARQTRSALTTAAAISREWVSETESSSPSVAADSAAEPCRRRRGASSPPPSTSTSCSRRPPMPSAFSAASLAAKRAARWRPGRAAPARVRELGGAEDPLGERRPALERALETLDLDQVDADPGGAHRAGDATRRRARR